MLPLSALTDLRIGLPAYSEVSPNEDSEEVMIVNQLTFPFRHNATTRRAKEFDLRRLVGLSYVEGKYVTATVIGVCENNGQVLVRRRPGGTVRLPGWLVRMILAEEISRLRTSPARASLLACLLFQDS